jgi:hypothetical protein
MSGLFVLLLLAIISSIVMTIIIVNRLNKCKYYKKDGKCVNKCDSKIYDFTTGSCVESCPSRSVEISGLYDTEWKHCVNEVDENKCEAEGKNIPRITEKGFECVKSCRDGDFISSDADGIIGCIPKCSGYIHPVTFKCVNSCGGDFPYTSTGKDSNGVTIKFCSDKQE